MKRYAGPAVGAAGLAFLLMFIGSKGNVADLDTTSHAVKSALQSYIGNQIEKNVMENFMPVIAFAESSSQDFGKRVAEWQMDEVMPLYGYLQEEQVGTEDKQMTIEMILMAEAEEGYGEDGVEQQGEATQSGENLEEMLKAENQAAIQKAQEQSGGSSDQDLTGQNQQVQNMSGQADGQISIQNGQVTEEGVNSFDNTFVPHLTPLGQVDMAALADYETLVQEFYTIDKSTMIGSDQLNTEKLASVDMTVSKAAEGPQILIYHTHSQEAFADSVEGDSSTSIVGVGAHLAEILTNQYGYQVLHHTASYDLPARDDAYSVALPEIEQVLEENPQIQVVIDLHRDAMDESTRLVTEVDGRPTARFMFFNGLSRTRKTGNIAYLYNENLDENLAFSFQMQKKAVEHYPGLTRKIYLKAYRYNMHLRPKTLLVELGAQNNTVEEAMNACDPLAHILDMVLSGEG